MADELNNERIGFSVDVTTGKSTENIDAVVKQIDSLKDRITDLKKQRKGADEVTLDGLNKSIREAQRELNKLNSVYASWIQKATDINTKPIGDVKKQIQELQRVLESWSGNPKDFQKQILDRFLIPNSAIEQARLYREAIRQIEGLANSGAISTQRAALATNRFSASLKDAERRARALKDAVDGIPSSTKRLTDRTVQQVFSGWDGKTDFLRNFTPAESYSKELSQLKKMADELKRGFGDSTDVGVQNRLKKAIDEITVAYREAKKAKDELNGRITGKAEEEAKKAQAKAQRELNKEIREQAKASKEAEQATIQSVRSAVQQYRRLQEQLEEVQAKIKMNYIDNYKTNRNAYGENLTPLLTQYKQLSKQIKDAERNMDLLALKSDFFGTTWDKITHRMGWVLTSFGAAGLFGGANAYFNTLRDVEKEMAQFSQVMSHGAPVVEGAEELSRSVGAASISVNAFGKSIHDLSIEDLQKGMREGVVGSKLFKDELDAMQQSLINLAIKYGEAHKDVAESATLWGRMYKDNNIVLTMTDAAMKLAVADSFSVVQANKNLESSIAQWGFEIKNNNDAMAVSSKICDSWTAIAHNMAVSAQDLSAANQRAASSMHAAGIEFDVGQAILATMLRNTQQAGGEIGNAMKSIIGSIHSKKAIEEIEKMGVAVYEFDENGSKHFRNVGQVLVDLMIKTQGTEKNLENLFMKIAGGKPSYLPQPQVTAA